MAGLLIKVSGDGKRFIDSAKKSFGAAELRIEPILSVPSQVPAFGAAQDGGATWLRVAAAHSDNPWDDAHAALQEGSAFAAAAGPDLQAIEPDHEQTWRSSAIDPQDAAPNKDALCAFDDQDGSGGKAKGPGPAWNFGAPFSQLKDARDRVGAKQAEILVAHLDTGYDPTHATLPLGLDKNLQRNFMAGEDRDSAIDQTPAGMELIRSRGHGAGTLSLLAGRLARNTPGFPNSDAWLGGAPQARIAPVRIADWVVRFSTSTMVQGIDYAREIGAHVLSMSMGGLSSQALVDAVNLAYDAGVVLVTAAGNNIAWVPTPKSIVFPARFKRVLAACGVMADGRAYAGLAAGTMQGNYGPASKMDTALGAYTPNTPWAQIDCGKIVDMNGAGTSAATPQIAAAAALWLAEHWDIVKQYPKPWMRVEAVRFALFEKAEKSTPAMNADETFEKIGKGVLRAADSLSVKPAAAASLAKLDPATSSWPWLDLIFGQGGVSLTGADERRQKMFALELTQMAQNSPDVEAAILDPDVASDQISAAARNRYLEAALDAGHPSAPLRALLETRLCRPAAAPGVSTKPITTRRKLAEPKPPARRLRVFALDPSAGKRLATLPINEATIETPWDDEETTGQKLRPGPVGEYLEVIDVDPASGRIYEPVDLNDKMLLAQNGLTPTEGDPKFHQQMVYAIAMKTIGHFEEALGRKALWAAHMRKEKDGKVSAHEVPRLRLYPHALRSRNAYYSPDKKAVLFGYFTADDVKTSSMQGGNFVFSCLSSDIVAHEMSHALLDGLHRSFEEASNPDVPAFHEAFADIVAVFQHFTIPEMVRFEVARQKGDISAARLLSGLALQFGEGTGVGHALRDYGKDRHEARTYDLTFDAHDRGEILVLAVYDAFLAIVARRTADLIRLGAASTREGALHPDLVERLTTETCKSARHVLRMCIRALDYCPPVDITFGEYLRALITADFELVDDDDLGYRTAFIEAFRNRGIPVRDVRTSSVEALTWNAPEIDNPKWLETVFSRVDFAINRKMTRSELFALNEKNRWRVWEALKRAFDADPDLCQQFGMKKEVARYDEDSGVLHPAKKGSTTFQVASVRPARRVTPDGGFQTDIVVALLQREPLYRDPKDPSKGWFWFRGGATLILDPNHGVPRIRYSIVKNIDSASRQDIQRGMASGTFMTPLQALYFGEAKFEPFAMMHAGRRDGHG